jgi:hypothetical protein
MKVLGKQMTTDKAPLGNEPGTHGTRGILRTLCAGFLGTFLVAVFTVALVGTLVCLSIGLGPLRLMSLLRGGATEIHVDQPTVVRQIQQLQRLETVSYTMDKIISGEHSSAYLPKFLAGDLQRLVSAFIRVQLSTH